MMASPDPSPPGRNVKTDISATIAVTVKVKINEMFIPTQRKLMKRVNPSINQTTKE